MDSRHHDPKMGTSISLKRFFLNSGKSIAFLGATALTNKPYRVPRLQISLFLMLHKGFRILHLPTNPLGVRALHISRFSGLVLTTNKGHSGLTKLD